MFGCFHEEFLTCVSKIPMKSRLDTREVGQVSHFVHTAARGLSTWNRRLEYGRKVMSSNPRICLFFFLAEYGFVVKVDSYAEPFFKWRQSVLSAA